MIRRLLGFLILGIMAIISVNFFLTLNESWASNLEKVILGKWRNMQNQETLEFFEDGTIIATYKDDNEDKQMVGNYRALDEARVRIDLAGWYQLGGPQVWRISVANDILVLSFPNKGEEKFRKVTKEMQIFLDGVTLYENKKFDEAAKLFTTAAEQGKIEAQDILGFMYLEGHGVEKSDQKAFKWANEAAKHGSMFSQRNLGNMYTKGLGVEKDIEKAIFWFEQAANQGDLNAQRNLGWIYATNENPKYRNGEKALKYAEMAYAQGVNNCYTFGVLAAAYARLGEFDKAVEHINNTKVNLLLSCQIDKDSVPADTLRSTEKIAILLKLYENHLPYDGFDIDEILSREKEERKKPNIADSNFDSTPWVSLKKGEENGDFDFREDGSLYYEGVLFESTMLAGYVNSKAIKAEKILISPPSPSNNFFFVKACGDDGGCWYFNLIDAKKKIIKPTYAGKYGPQESIYWTPDERYAIFKHYDYDEGSVHYYVDLTTAISFERQVMTADEIYQVILKNSELALDVIRKNWKNPAVKNEKQITEALVEITIKKNGNISNVWFKQKSNIQAINDSAWQAIKKSDPLPPLPEAYPHASLQVIVSFPEKGVSDASQNKKQ